MNDAQRRPGTVERVVLVNRYSTPFAILLVTMGIVLTNPVGWARDVSIALLLGGIAMNIAAVAWLKRAPESSGWLVPGRMTANVLINVALVYVLGAFWEPIWLLLALTPLAGAIYADKLKTLTAALGVSAALVFIAALRGTASPLEWGETAAQAAFIVFVSLMVNELAGQTER